MCSSSEIGVDGLGVCIDLVLKPVECFEGDFDTDGSEVSSIKEGVLVVNTACHGRLRH